VEGGWRPLWVVDFPMFEWDADEKRWVAMHHPFTSPRNDDPAALAAAPGAAIARAYDMVLNGSEIGGGSVRIHRSEMQSTVFGLLGIAPDEAQKKFGFLLDALKFGAPPHGGIAFGLDRLAMLMTGAESIREVTAFPKTQTAAGPLTDPPTAVMEARLPELDIRGRAFLADRAPHGTVGGGGAAHAVRAALGARAPPRHHRRPPADRVWEAVRRFRRAKRRHHRGERDAHAGGHRLHRASGQPSRHA